jgi:peptide chain release factor 2
MMLRMYERWAADRKFDVELLEASPGEEAGLKSATFTVGGENAYGILRAERGKHRLVRQSPFDQAHRRHTAFATVIVAPLLPDDTDVEIDEADLKIDTYRAQGAGGQHVNKTDSAVRMTHLPTGIVVSMQNEKSQIQNRAAALKVMQSRLLALRQEEEAATKKAMAGDVKASWGDQMRSYVLHPYQMVKDLRTEYEVGNPTAVFDGDLDGFLEAGIRWRRTQEREAE